MEQADRQDVRSRLQAREQAVAARWLEAIVDTGFVPANLTEVSRQVASWTAQVGDLLAAEAWAPEAARSVGAALGRLHAREAETLAQTLAALGQEILVGMPPGRAAVLQPRLVAILAAIAAGFLQQAQATLLEEQELARDALAVALRRSEARYRAIFQHSALGIALLDMHGRILETNAALHTILGYGAAELRHVPAVGITHPEDVAKTLRFYDEIMSGRRDQGQLVKRYRHQDGQIVYARLSMSLVREDGGEPQFAITLVEDLTARRRAEAERLDAFRGLTARVEAERLRLARELHDGPMQTLLGALGYLGAYERATDQAAARPHLQTARRLVAGVVDMLRTLAGELRPPVLERYGLAAALRSHASEIQAAHPELEMHVDVAPGYRPLPERMELALFRICQEALRNVVDHARARHAWLRLDMEAGGVTLEVRDDGAGFAPPVSLRDLARQGHFGLLSMEERTKAIAGDLTVRSSPGQGTSITVVAPRRRARRAKG